MKLKLNGVDRGLSCYATATFSDSYKSTLKLYAFSMMMDIKFRTWKLMKKDKTHIDTERENICSVKEYFEFYLKKTQQG